MSSNRRFDREAFFGKTKPRGVWYWLLSVALLLLYVSFLLVRSTEIIAMATRSPLYTLLSFSGLISLLSLFVSPPRTLGFYARRVFLVCVIVAQFKNEIDYQFLKMYSLSAHSAPAYARFLHGYIAVVTGANSGTGYAISEQLSMLGATVVMACRSKDKCEAAAQAVRNSVFKVRSTHGAVGGPVYFGELDLSDLNSVRAFAKSFRRKHRHLDFLVLNAGAVPPPGSRTEQGIEACIGSMHIGHAALTRWLRAPLQRRRRAPLDRLSARIVYVGSQAYMAGNFDPSLLIGDGRGDLHGEKTDNCGGFGPLGMLPCCPIGQCPHTNGYGRAKLANILHVHEFQRRHDEASLRALSWFRPRRIVAVALHPGAVHTNIHPFLSSSLTSVLLRSSEQASRLMMHALLSDSFLPSSFLDAAGYAHDLQGYRELHLPTHIKAFPQSANMQFTQKNSVRIPSWDLWHWRRTSLVWRGAGESNGGDIETETQKREISNRLWEVTEKLISDFEWGKLKKKKEQKVKV